MVSDLRVDFINRINTLADGTSREPCLHSDGSTLRMPLYAEYPHVGLWLGYRCYVREPVISIEPSIGYYSYLEQFSLEHEK